MSRARAPVHPLAVVAGIAAGLMLMLLVAGIGVLIVILKDSRDHIRAQDAKTAVLLEKIRVATPAARQVPPLIGEARPVVRNLGRAIGPLTQSTSAVADATQRVPALAGAAQALAASGVPVLDELGRANVGRVLAATGAAANAVLTRDRLSTALDATNRLLDEVRAQNLVPVTARAARETPGLIRRLLRIQLVTLKAQQISLQTQLTTLDIQRQALASIKSIDRKTGGPVPPQSGPLPAP